MKLKKKTITKTLAGAIISLSVVLSTATRAASNFTTAYDNQYSSPGQRIAQVDPIARSVFLDSATSLSSASVSSSTVSGEVSNFSVVNGSSQSGGGGDIEKVKAYIDDVCYGYRIYPASWTGDENGYACARKAW